MQTLRNTYLVLYTHNHCIVFCSGNAQKCNVVTCNNRIQNWTLFNPTILFLWNYGRLTSLVNHQPLFLQGSIPLGRYSKRDVDLLKSFSCWKTTPPHCSGYGAKADLQERLMHLLFQLAFKKPDSTTTSEYTLLLRSSKCSHALCMFPEEEEQASCCAGESLAARDHFFSSAAWDQAPAFSPHVTLVIPGQAHARCRNSLKLKITVDFFFFFFSKSQGLLVAF